MTSASTHDSQVVISLGTHADGRTENLYDLMDSAHEAIKIWAYSISRGRKPIIDVNPRSSSEMKEALEPERKARRTLGIVFPEERRYAGCSTAERLNGWLKDEFGGRHVRVRGHDKVFAHLMFDMTVLAVSQLIIIPPIYPGSSPLPTRQLLHRARRSGQLRLKFDEHAGPAVVLAQVRAESASKKRELPCAAPDASQAVLLPVPNPSAIL